MTRVEKSGAPTRAEIIGVITSAVTDAVMAPKDAPMMTATARSTTLPRRMKSLKPLSIGQFSLTPRCLLAHRTRWGERMEAQAGTGLLRVRELPRRRARAEETRS